MIANVFDVGLSILHTFEDILGRKAEPCLYIGLSTLFDSIVLIISVTDKCLLIDIACLPREYRNNEVTNLGRIRSWDNIARFSLRTYLRMPHERLI